MAILSLFDARSPAARIVKVAVEADPVLTLVVTLISPSVAERDGVVSGSASAKLTVFELNVNLAWAFIVAFIVRVAFVEAASARLETNSRANVTGKATNNIFFTFFLPLSL